MPQPLLLIPVKIETRFVQDELWIRVFPDSILLQQAFSAHLSEEEELGRQSWIQSEADARKAIWHNLVSRYGVARSQWLIQPELPIEDHHLPTAVFRFLPERFKFFGLQGEHLIELGQGQPIPSTLELFEEAGTISWMNDFDEAVHKGMGIRVSRDTFTGKLDQLLAIGIRQNQNGQDALQQLITHHQFTTGFSFLSPGTPTNNLPTEKTPHSDRDDFEAQQSFARIDRPDDAVQSGDRSFADRLAAATGLPIALFRQAEKADIKVADEIAKKIRLACYPALFDEALNHYFSNTVSNDLRVLIQEHYGNYVQAGSPLPAIKVGNQPYGILPTRRIRRVGNSESVVYNGGVEYFLRNFKAFMSIALEKWLAMAKENVPQVGAGPEEDADINLLQILAMQAGSVPEEYEFGSAIPSSVLKIAYGKVRTLLTSNEVGEQAIERMLGLTPDDDWLLSIKNQIKQNLADFHPLEFEPNLPIPIQVPNWTKKIQIPLVSTGGTFIKKALQLAKAKNPALDIADLSNAPDSAPSILEELLLQSLTKIGPFAIELPGLVKDIAEYYQTNPETAKRTLENSLREAIDLNSYRLDAWISSLANKRLDEINVGEEGLLLGTYGVVENLIPSENAAALTWADAKLSIDVAVAEIHQHLHQHYILTRDGTIFSDSEFSRASTLTDEVQILGYERGTHGKIRSIAFVASDLYVLTDQQWLLKTTQEEPLLFRIAEAEGRQRNLFQLFSVQGRLLSRTNRRLAILEEPPNYRRKRWRRIRSPRNPRVWTSLTQVNDQLIGLGEEQLWRIPIDTSNNTAEYQQHSTAEGMTEVFAIDDKILARKSTGEMLELALRLNNSAPGGIIHTPSVDQAILSGIFKSTFLSHNRPGEGNPFALHLSSDQIQRSLMIQEGLRNGQELGALLGYQFERDLHEAGADSSIYVFRKKYPFDQDRGAKEINVVNGLDIARDELAQGNTEAQVSAIKKLRQTLDACSDSLLFEAGYHAIQGNHDRSAATMDAFKGKSIPHQQKSLKTPIPGVGIQHKMVWLLDQVVWEEINTDPRINPRAAVQPALEYWLKKQIGPLSEIACRVGVKTGATIIARPIVRLEELNLGYLDFLYLSATPSSGEHSGLELLLIAHLFRQDGPWRGLEDAQFQILDEAVEGFTKNLLDAMEFARYLLNLLGNSRPLETEDLLPPYEPSQTSNDLAGYQQLFLSLQEAGKILETIAKDFITSTDLVFQTALPDQDLPPTLAFKYGIDGALPKPFSNESTLPKEKLSKSIIKRVNSCREDWRQLLDMGGVQIEEQDYKPAIKRLLAVGKELFGSSFLCIPSIQAPPIFLQELQQRPERQIIGELGQERIRLWVQGLAQVSSTTEAFEDVLMIKEAWQDPLYQSVEGMPGQSWTPPASHFKIVQYIGGEVGKTYPWLALNHEEIKAVLALPENATTDELARPEAGRNYPAGGCSIVIYLPEVGIPQHTQRISGLVIDQFSEHIPDKQVDSGISFQYDAPNNEAPQALLLALPEEEQEGNNWTELEVAAIVRDTIDLAKVRMVDPDAIQDFGYLLPASYLDTSL